MIARLTLTAAALTLALPALAQTTAVITGGLAPTCIEPGKEQGADPALLPCSAGQLAAIKRGDDDSDDKNENEGGEDDDDEGDDD